jgi:hypothetical protein
VDDRESLYEYIDKIKKIDQLLAAPIRSLIKFTERSLDNKAKGPAQEVVQLPLYFPPWVAVDREFPSDKLNSTSATCCATLQRLWRRKRRFPRLEKDLERLGEKLQENQGSARILPDLLARGFLPHKDKEGIGIGYVQFLQQTDLLGRTKPLLASDILWVLINAGEGVAYTGAGFLSFFGILWSLRYTPDRFNAGTAIGLAPPTAYITTRCLLPIHALRRACVRRADLLKEIIGILEDMDKLMGKEVNSNTQSREFPFKLERLATVLYDYAEITLARRSFRACAEELEKRAGAMNLASSPSAAWDGLRVRLAEAIREGGKTGQRVVAESSEVIRMNREAAAEFSVKEGPELGLQEGTILRSILVALKNRSPEALQNLGVEVPRPAFATPQAEERFWQEQLKAARESLRICILAFRALEESSGGCARLASDDLKTIKRSLEQLETANRTVAENIEAEIQDSIRWCESVMHREIAHASAGNLTDLDPAELVSGLAVAVAVRRINSPAQLADAINKALTGAREDGSWMPGQPFAIDDKSGLSESASTAAIVWMLSGAIARHRSVTTADETLGRYLDWLEATKRSLKLPGKPGAMEPLEISGWVSERMVRSDRIDFWFTAFVINSLLNIRGLMEFRLWQLCEQRFTVLQGGRDLSDLEAVDLGANQESRLHRRLARMARRAESEDYKKADYAVVLHGPPGSSKTVIAQAVSRQMWRALQRLAGGEPRLVRITPADFTRGGEARLDSEARVIFDLLSNVRNVTILFDEIDDLLRERNPKEQPTFLKLVVPAMLNRLQDLRDACARQEIFFILATNYIEKIEPALIRKGRIDHAIPLVYPDPESRLAIIEDRIEKLRREIVEESRDWVTTFLLSELGQQQIDRTTGWPWMTLDSMCEEVARGVRSFAKAWREAASSEDKEEIQKRSKEWLDGIVDTYKASLSEVKYVSRMKAKESSAELREEFLHYMFASARTMDVYEAALREKLEPLGQKDQFQQILSRGERLWRSQGRL